MQLVDLNGLVLANDVVTEPSSHQSPVYLEPRVLSRDEGDHMFVICEHCSHNNQRSIRIYGRPRFEEVLSDFRRVDDHRRLPKHRP